MRNTTKSRMAAVAALGLAILTSGSARAEDDDAGQGGHFRRFGLGAEAGALMPGAVNVGGAALDTGAGPLGAVYADLIAGGIFSFGAAWAFAKTSIEGQTGATLLDFAVTMKGRFALSPTVQLRPGVTFGYQLLATELDTARGFDPGLTISLAFGLGESTALVLDGGFLSQPVGGTGSTTVTFAPIAFAAVGVELGR